MGCDVDQPALRTLFPQDLLAGVAFQEDLRLGKNAGQRSKFLINAGCLRIRNTHEQARACLVGTLSMTLSEDAGARRVRNGKAINKVSFTVKKRVEGYITQQFVRHYDQILAFDLGSNRGKQFPIKFVQACLGGLQERRVKLIDVAMAEAKFR